MPRATPHVATDQPLAAGDSILTGTPTSAGLYFIILDPGKANPVFDEDWSLFRGLVPWYVGMAVNIQSRWKEHRNKLGAADKAADKLQELVGTPLAKLATAASYGASQLHVRTVPVRPADLAAYEALAIDVLQPIANGVFGGRFKQTESDLWTNLGSCNA